MHHQCGRYAKAVEDFQACSEQEPENKHYALLLKRSEEQRMKLQEDLSHERTGGLGSRVAVPLFRQLRRLKAAAPPVRSPLGMWRLVLGVGIGVGYGGCRWI